jgi:hypothetical protein
MLSFGMRDVGGAKTALDLDHQFDSGSGIVIRGLNSVQVTNLVVLGKVWGFLKYYHPEITAGHRHWDYDLFRVLPAILEAHDRESANTFLLHWVLNLGNVAPCNPCAKLDENDIDLRPDLDWIADKALLGTDLSKALLAIRDNRTPQKQFYVSKVPSVGNPSFDRELGYEHIKFPDAGFQLLALYRFWNIIEYWSPNRDMIGEDWNRVLAEFIPRVALAKDAETYQLELTAFIARAHDGHANLWSSLDVRPPVGKCWLPVKVRFVEDSPVIAGSSAATSDSASPLKVGDVITQLDGVPAVKLIADWSPYYAASNDAFRFREIVRYMVRGACGESSIGIRRGRQEEVLKITRIPLEHPFSGGIWHDLPGPTFRLLSKDVAYLKLSSAKAADAAHYVEQAAGTKGLIIDIRNYPSEFVVFALGSLLVDKTVPFARFTECDLSNPGAFHWTRTMALTPQSPHYSGKIVILVDETSLSQAEYTAMAFRTVPGAVVVGSATAGADGDVSPFLLPGGLQTLISGLGVFYPDKTPTQRVGIVSNVEVRPTIAGIRAGRDEVLEQALRQIVGRDVPAEDIERMAKP